MEFHHLGARLATDRRSCLVQCLDSREGPLRRQSGRVHAQPVPHYLNPAALPLRITGLQRLEASLSQAPRGQLMVCAVLWPEGNPYRLNALLHMHYARRLSVLLTRVIATCP
jgi:hypothetical protein